MNRKLLGFFVLIALIASFVTPLAFPMVRAQDNSLVVLNDATPSAQVIVTLNNGAPGVVYIELENVRVVLRDKTGADVLSLGDKRVTGLGIQFAQGVETYTLLVERLPGIAQGQARIVAQSELPQVINATAQDKPVSLTGPSFARIPVASSVVLPVAANPTANMLTLQFPQQDQVSRVLDSTGNALLTANTGRAINGLSLRIEPGAYVFSAVNRDPKAAAAEVLIALSPAPTSTLLAMVPTPGATDAAAKAETCRATVTAVSANLRSGPGTAYSVLGYTSRGAELIVGGVNSAGGWLLVQNQTGAAWLSAAIVQLSGNCKALTSYDIPVRNAEASQPVVIRQPASPSVQPSQPAQGDDKGGDKGDDKGGEGDDD